jgi:hypothetical protein
MVDQPAGRRSGRAAVDILAFASRRLEKDAADDRQSIAAIEGRES